MTRSSRRFGEIAVQLGYITTGQLQEALATQEESVSRGAAHRFVGQILIDLGHMTEKQAIEVLKERQVVEELG